MKRLTKTLIIISAVTQSFCVWASVGGKDNVVKEILSLIGSALLSSGA